VQNRLEDLGALISFLKVPHLDQKAGFQKHIIAPLLLGKEDSTRNLRILLNAMCLRRNISLVQGPKARYQTQTVVLSPTERMMYNEILQSSLEEINNTISSRSYSKAYSSIPRAILCTRMLCDHGTHRKTTSKSRLATPAMDNEDTLATLLEGDEGMTKIPSSKLASP
jgi:SWI/SNF-related matrix-associated actin-dependent regulator of chromatin subfamily A3